MKDGQRHGGIVGPLVLIAAGTVFLLINLGLLHWTVWGMLLRLWPLLLIALGLELLFGRQSRWGRLLAAAVILLALGGAIWVAAGQVPTGDRLTTMQIRQPLEGASRADVTLRLGAGRLRLLAVEDAVHLLEGVLPQSGQGAAVREFRKSGDLAYLKLEEARGAALWPFGNGGGDHTWDLRLNGAVPTRLTIHTGVGESDLDLVAATLTGLQVKTGVGLTRLVLPARGRLEAQLEGGVGQTVVIVPASMAARVQAQTGLGHIDVGDSFTGQDGVYTSPGYDRAADRVDLLVKGGIGQIVVRQEATR